MRRGDVSALSRFIVSQSQSSSFSFFFTIIYNIRPYSVLSSPHARYCAMTTKMNNTAVPDATSSSSLTMASTLLKIPQQPAAVPQYATHLPPPTVAQRLPDMPSSSSHVIGSADTASSAVGLTSSSSSPTKKKTTARQHPLRRGKWTTEEEAYATRLINEFKSGLLPLTDGTTLRAFLSKLLNCDPMRISKKFVGNNCIGKQVFRRKVADVSRLSEEQLERMRCELSE